MTAPEEVRSGLEALWARIFGLYRRRPAIGSLGAEVVGLALEAEDFIASDPSRARAKILRARELLRDLGEESAA